MTWTAPNVNYERLYENLGKTYEIGVVSGIYYEALQNAMDANATWIRFDYDSKTRTLIIIDNGKGMDEKILLEHYHGLASSDKDKAGKRKRYGIGASVFPMACNMVKTISKADDSPHVVSLWDKKKGIQVYSSTEEDKKAIVSATGTQITIENIEEKHLYFKDKNKIRAMENELKKVIDDYYYLAILIQKSKRKNLDVIYNGNAISIKHLDKNELTPEVGDTGNGTWEINEKVKICGKEYSVTGQIYYLSKSSPSKSGIKFTTDKDIMILNRKPYRRFDIPADISNRLGGIIQCTYLSDIQLSTRNGFQENTKIWEGHNKVTTKILERMIKEIMHHRSKRMTKEELKLLSEINKCVEKVITELPDFAVLGLISPSGTSGQGSIVSKGSTIATGLKGTMSSGTNTPRTPTGTNPKHKSSVIQGAGTSRKKKGAPPIRFAADKTKPAVFTEKSRICINQENKMYKKTKDTSVSIHKWYITDLVGTELSSTLPIPDSIKDDLASISKYIIMKKKEFTHKVTEYWF